MSERQQSRVLLGEPWPGGHLPDDPLRASFERLRPPATGGGPPGGLDAVLRSVFPIQDFSETCELAYVSVTLSPPEVSPAECRRRGLNHAETIRVTLRLLTFDPPPPDDPSRRQIRDVREQEISLCELPRLTPEGTFVIAGVDRVVVRQIAESPGLRFVFGPADKIKAVIQPERGAVLSLEHDRKGLIFFRVNRSKKKLPVTVLLRAIGLSTGEILAALHPLETVVIEPGGKLSVLFDPEVMLGQRAWQDVRVGGEVIVRRSRKFTKVSLRQLRAHGVDRLPTDDDQLIGRVLAADVVDEASGEILRGVGDALQYGDLRAFARCHIERFTLVVADGLLASTAIIDTLRVDRCPTTDEAQLALYSMLRPGDAPTLETAQHLLQYLFFDDERLHLSAAGRRSLDRKLGAAAPTEAMCLTRADIVGTLRELLRRQFGSAGSDDIDHVGEAVVRDAAALAAAALRLGLVRLARSVRERLSLTQDPAMLLPHDLINGRPVQSALDDFFGWSRVSERVDFTNPLAELTQRRRLTTSEPDPDSPRRSNYRRRDRHDSHLGVFCPVEEPRLGGLSPALGLRIGARGELVAGVAPRLSLHDPDAPPPRPWEVLGLGAALIPFVNHDPPEAAAAGIENLRAALPPLHPEVARVATGLEAEVAHSSGLSVLATAPGHVVRATAREVVVATDQGEVAHALRTFEPSTRGAYIHQRPAVSAGQRVEPGELLAAGPGVVSGELAVGHDLLTALLPTFDVSLVVSESVVHAGKFAYLQLREYRSLAVRSGLGDESFTRDIPDADADEIAHLDERGLVRVGSRVRGGDLLAGKVRTEATTDADTGPTLRDRSLRLPAGREGVVITSRLDDRRAVTLPTRVPQRATVVVATLQPLAVGDLLGSRHGDRGTVARLAPVEDMPVLPDGRPVEVILNPNLLEHGATGLLLELLAGGLGLPVLAPPFAPVTERQLRSLLRHEGRAELRDGRTGEPLDQPVTVGHLHLVRLPPLAADTLVVRSTGPYDPHTDLPVASAHEPDGQLIDENDVAALAAHGAAYTLRELLGAKSDDPVARGQLADMIRTGGDPPAHVTQGLDALLRELRAAALDVQVIGDEDDTAATAAVTPVTPVTPAAAVTPVTPAAATTPPARRPRSRRPY